jgi:hypothetical protein
MNFNQNNETTRRRAITSYPSMQDLKSISVVIHLSKLFTPRKQSIQQANVSASNRAVLYHPSAYVLARFRMRYGVTEKPIEQDNLRKGWLTVLTPGEGVKMQMHHI